MDKIVHELLISGLAINTINGKTVIAYRCDGNSYKHGINLLVFGAQYFAKKYIPNSRLTNSVKRLTFDFNQMVTAIQEGVAPNKQVKVYPTARMTRV